MRAVRVNAILGLGLGLFVGCHSDPMDPPQETQQGTVATDTIVEFRVEDVVGVYNGPYSYWWHNDDPYPGDGAQYDSTVIHVIADTSLENVFHAGGVPFSLRSDGTIDILYPASSFSGAFTWVGDTLHLEWEYHWFSGAYHMQRQSSFNGNRQ